jgi:hypothetical protein
MNEYSHQLKRKKTNTPYKSPNANNKVGKVGWTRNNYKKNNNNNTYK